MGARCTFVFKDSENTAVALYSHWGEYEMNQDLAAALNHAAPRIQMGDAPYATRMVISYLIKDSILDETGFGIYSCNPNDLGFMDHPIIIDWTNQTIEHDSGKHSINDFIEFYSKQLV